MITKFVFRMPTRQEYRKFNFKRNDGVLKSLEYIVHTTILDPPLEEYLKLEQEKITLTEDIGQRLVDMLMTVKDDENVSTLIVDITKPIVPINKQPSLEQEIFSIIEKIVLSVLEKHKKSLTQ